MEERDFKGKVAVITGAASGLGAGLCKRFGEAGAIIAGLDKDEKGLATLAEDLTAAGIQIRTFTCDVTDAAACEKTMLTIVREMGDIYLLVNNAGVSHISQFRKTDLSVFKKVIDISLFGSIHCTHAAIDSIIKAKGMVVGVSSVAGFAPLTGRTGYAAAKHGMVGFLESLRTEIAELGANVMIVHATYIKTNIDKNNLRANGTPMNAERSTSGPVLMPSEAADAIFTAASNNERMLLLGETAQFSWNMWRDDPLQFEQIMLSLNRYVLED